MSAQQLPITAKQQEKMSRLIKRTVNQFTSDVDKIVPNMKLGELQGVAQSSLIQSIIVFHGVTEPDKIIDFTKDFWDLVDKHSMKLPR